MLLSSLEQYETTDGRPELADMAQAFSDILDAALREDGHELERHERISVIQDMVRENANAIFPLSAGENPPPFCAKYAGALRSRAVARALNSKR